MAEEKTTPPGAIVQNANSSIDQYPDALKLYVQDGHLFVQGYDADLGVYAPGQWKRAKRANSASWEQPAS